MAMSKKNLPERLDIDSEKSSPQDLVGISLHKFYHLL
jgi:hypothetical protein